MPKTKTNKSEDTVTLAIEARVEVLRLTNGVWLINGECIACDDDHALIREAVISAVQAVISAVHNK